MRLPVHPCCALSRLSSNDAERDMSVDEVGRRRRAAQALNPHECWLHESTALGETTMNRPTASMVLSRRHERSPTASELRFCVVRSSATVSPNVTWQSRRAVTVTRPLTAAAILYAGRPLG